jgi:DNA-binding transcriptional regulator/RsmH inhibitor MraZ
MTNDPLTALLPVLADTMKFATQALAQSTALAELLVAKGVITKADLDGRMDLGQKLRDNLMAKLDEEIQKQS